jgi:hypothetical protein
MERALSFLEHNSKIKIQLDHDAPTLFAVAPTYRHGPHFWLHGTIAMSPYPTRLETTLHLQAITMPPTQKTKAIVLRSYYLINHLVMHCLFYSLHPLSLHPNPQLNSIPDSRLLSLVSSPSIIVNHCRLYWLHWLRADPSPSPSISYQQSERSPPTTTNNNNCNNCSKLQQIVIMVSENWLQLGDHAWMFMFTHVTHHFCIIILNRYAEDSTNNWWLHPTPRDLNQPNQPTKL